MLADPNKNLCHSDAADKVELGSFSDESQSEIHLNPASNRTSIESTEVHQSKREFEYSYIKSFFFCSLGNIIRILILFFLLFHSCFISITNQ